MKIAIFFSLFAAIMMAEGALEHVLQRDVSFLAGWASCMAFGRCFYGYWRRAA